MGKVIEFPEEKQLEFLVGPFEEYRVVIDDRCIPKLTGRRYPDGRVELFVDRRFGAVFANAANAYQAAVLIAHAMAIGAGYSHSGAESKGQPFAAKVMQMDGGL